MTIRTPMQWLEQTIKPQDPSHRWQDTAVIEQLGCFTGWRLDKTVLSRYWQVKDFTDVQTMVKIIMSLSERLDHHPDVAFGYNWLKILIHSQSAGGIADNDWIWISHLETALQQSGGDH